MYYYFLVDNRDKKEVVNYIKQSAILCRSLLLKSEQNYYVANIVACLLVERGRPSEG